MRRLATACLVLVSVSAVAQVAQPGRPLQSIIDDYVREALASNLALRSQSLDVERQLAIVAEARSRFLPQLGLDARYTWAEMRLAVLFKPTKDAPKWLPLAEIRINVEQATTPKLVKVDRQTRLFNLEWSGEPQIKVETSFDKGYQPENKDVGQAALEQLVLTSWRGWIGHGPVAQVPISDIEIGITKVRLDSVEWKAPMLNVNFTAPGVKITNSSTVPFTYETKGPFSDWGGPYTLEPGKSHEYVIAYPLTYRQKKSGESPVYLLPPGSHSEFRVPQSGGAPSLFQAREELRSGDD